MRGNDRHCPDSERNPPAGVSSRWHRDQQSVRAERKPSVVALVEDGADRVLPSGKGTAEALVSNAAGRLIEMTDEELSGQRQVSRIFIVRQVGIVKDRLHVEGAAFGMLAPGRNENAVAKEFVAAAATVVLAEKDELAAGGLPVSSDDLAILDLDQVSRVAVE